MIRNIITIIFFMAVTCTISAQNVTYNYDSAKKNQITVMETGAGALTPELYYTTLHNNYKKTAASKNKLSYRTAAGINGYNQVDDSEAIDSALTSRAKIEALNVADRQIDLAWQVEGGKVENVLEKFRGNIGRIISCGGSVASRTRWYEIYNMYCQAVNEIKQAYMPNAKRKQEYLRIYSDVEKNNEILVRQLAHNNNDAITKHLLAARADYSTADKENIIANARGKWKQAGASGKSHSSSSTDDDGTEETVSR